jgi:2-beta-glucuronyltransferase
MTGKVVLISGHDYRSARRSNFHHIADALVGLGFEVSFISIGYSYLSLLKGDSRNFLSRRANQLEIQNHVQCFLWKTKLHPFYPKILGLNFVSSLMYKPYAWLPNRFIDKELRSATVILVESGLTPLFLPRARARNSSAQIIYYASDELRTIGAHPFLQAQLENCRDIINHVAVVSRKMAPGFAWAADRLYCVPHGVNPIDFATDAGSPYTSRINGVSVGSMLFDPSFFIHASTQFPDVEFHVIGSGSKCRESKNVHVYPEMPFKDTIPFIKNATFGIAPYCYAPGCEYLCDTSMKLMQYDYLEIAAVCPYFAVGANQNRHGYIPGVSHSIVEAINAAMKRNRSTVRNKLLTWTEVVLRLLNPAAFHDTRV